MPVLVVTGREDATADYLCRRFAVAGVDHIRFDSDGDLLAVRPEYELGHPTLAIAGRALAPDEVTAVWFRRPTALQLPVGRDDAERRHVAGEWTAAVEGFLAHVPRQRWVNHPSANAAASYKMEQLSRAAMYGLRVPPSVVTRRPERLRALWEACEGEVVAKPLLSGHLEREEADGDTLIYTSRVTTALLERAAELLPACPTLFQQLVRKRFDARVCVLDDAVHAVALHAPDAAEGGRQRLDVRRDGMADVRYEHLDLPPDVSGPLLALVRSYGLRFAAADLARGEDGQWYFFEINPNGQWAWLDLENAADVGSSFVRAFEVARRG